MTRYGQSRTTRTNGLSDWDVVRITRMAQQKDITTTPKLTRENAQKIMQTGRMRRGDVVINVYDNTLSNLPQITNEELRGQDFIINSLCGELNTQYGAAWIFEIGVRPQLPTHSWLVGQKSVIGQNLLRMADKRGGFKQILPLWVHLMQYEPQSGAQAYWCLETPKTITDALEENEAESAPPTTNNQPPRASDLEDLPF